jgi:hypothetical protein
MTKKDLSTFAKAMKAHNDAFLNRPEGYISERDQAYLDLVKPTYIENWNSNLFSYSMPTILIPLSEKEHITLLNIADAIEKFDENIIPISIQSLWDKIENELQKHSEGYFIRLGSRSPKDSYTAVKNNYCITSTFDVFACLLESMRVFEDLCFAKSVKYSPYIALRQWIKIEQKDEFRCFVRNGEIVGISQYFYNDYYPSIELEKDKIEASIRILFNKIKNYIPENIIFDVIYNSDFSTLLEINPYSNFYTNPCLFTWKPEEFDIFQFRTVSKK